MKKNTLIKTMLFLLVAMSIYQFALFIPIYLANTQMEEKAYKQSLSYPLELQEIAKKEIYTNLVDSISDEVVFRIPLISEYTYGNLKERQLKLGLDLKGGTQLTLGFDRSLFIKNLVANPSDSSFKLALDQTTSSTSKFQSDYITNFLKQFQQIEEDKKILACFGQAELLKEKLNSNTSISKLEKMIQEEALEIIDQTKHLMEQRVNYLGLSQIDISQDKNKGLLYIEIPDVNSAKEVKEKLLPAAALQFWETYSVTDPEL